MNTKKLLRIVWFQLRKREDLMWRRFNIFEHVFFLLLHWSEKKQEKQSNVKRNLQKSIVLFATRLCQDLYNSQRDAKQMRILFCSSLFRYIFGRVSSVSFRLNHHSSNIPFLCLITIMIKTKRNSVSMKKSIRWILILSQRCFTSRWRSVSVNYKQHDVVFLRLFT